MPNLYTFTLKMATAMFAKTMDNYPRSMSPPPKAEVTY
jgi:hypothetical protein